MSNVLTSKEARKIALDFLLKNNYIEKEKDLDSLKGLDGDNVFENNSEWHIAFDVNNGWGDYETWYFDLQSSDLSVCCIMNGHGQKRYYNL